MSLHIINQLVFMMETTFRLYKIGIWHHVFDCVTFLILCEPRDVFL